MLVLSSIVLSCPQCAAPLPRLAQWRTVQCSYCGATILRGEETVRRASFRETWLRTRSRPASAQVVQWRGTDYRILAPLGHGEHSEVLLAERLGALPERVTLKQVREDDDRELLVREFDVLRSLQSLRTDGAAHFTRRLPQPLGVGIAQGDADPPRHALLLRHPAGYWGSLADVIQAQPQGIDPRHAVWIWRRMLDVLAFIHASGWSHGALTPAHALVHPADHGVLMIGWRRARQSSGAAHTEALSLDLQQSAWILRAMLHGSRDGEQPGFGSSTPAPLAELLQRCSEQPAACAALQAAGIQAALSVAAQASFGAPRFVRFNPAPSGA